jgi:hypothetical protein
MNLSTRAVSAAREMLSGPSGLKVSIETLEELRGSLATEARFHVDTAYWSQKLADRIPNDRFPRVSVALTKMYRGQKDKLADFSALASMQFELTLTHEKAADLQSALGDYVDALCDVLNRNQGLWSSGVFYAGGFQVDVSPVNRGGLNFVQNATISFEIHLWQE